MPGNKQLAGANPIFLQLNRPFYQLLEPIVLVGKTLKRLSSRGAAHAFTKAHAVPRDLLLAIRTATTLALYINAKNVLGTIGNRRH